MDKMESAGSYNTQIRRLAEKKCLIQSNFKGSNIFETKEICLRYG